MRSSVTALFAALLLGLLTACAAEAIDSEAAVADPCEILFIPAESLAFTPSWKVSEAVVTDIDRPRLIWHCGTPDPPEPEIVIAAHPRPISSREPLFVQPP